jgi:hypothetical protein
MKRPFFVWVLALVLLLLSAGGFSGGIPMLADPANGGYLDFGEILALLPVSSLLLPGLFLLSFMGLLPLVLIYGLLARPVWPWLDSLFAWSRHHWSWTGTLFLAGGTAIWLLYEGSLVGWWPITIITAVQGLIIFLLTLIPRVRNYYQIHPK